MDDALEGAQKKLEEAGRDALACKPRLLRAAELALLRSYGEVADDNAKVGSLLEELVGY